MKGKPPEAWQEAQVRRGNLAIDATHTVHWRSYGSPLSQAVLFLHGGPGSGADVSHLRFFNPDKHYVIFHDQRGTGQSTPGGCIVDNTTHHLVADIEELRSELGIDRWVVFGGSWGATLALIYAQHHPTYCQALVLRGVSNSHSVQHRWVMEQRPRQLPDRHNAFISCLSAQQRHHPARSHLENILSEDPLRQSQAMYAVRALETGLTGPTAEPFSEEQPREQNLTTPDPIELSRARIYLHYWVNNKFLGDSECLPNPAAIKETPITFIHGESDWICPLMGAKALCEVLTHATLIAVPDAGHSPLQHEMTVQLRQIMHRY